MAGQKREFALEVRGRPRRSSPAPGGRGSPSANSRFAN